MSTRILRSSAALLLVVAWGQGFTTTAEEGGPSDRVAFRRPSEPTVIEHTRRAVEWLQRHVVKLESPGERRPIPVIAWHDPTLAPGDPTRRVAYLITDTLWSSRALEAFDPAVSSDMRAGLQTLGRPGNGLQDVLFHPLPQLLHRSDDDDPVHGHALGRYAVVGGGEVEVRVMRQRWDPAFEAGHPSLFAEHAVYQALHEYWKGDREAARRRILGVINDDRSVDPKDSIFWDDEAGVLVDHTSIDAWDEFHAGKRRTLRNSTFKLGVLLYAVRLLSLEQEVGPALERIKVRLWSAQQDDGGLAHFVEVSLGDEGLSRRPIGATGEATAIAIMSETICPGH